MSSRRVALLLSACVLSVQSAALRHLDTDHSPYQRIFTRASAQLTRGESPYLYELCLQLPVRTLILSVIVCYNSA